MSLTPAAFVGGSIISGGLGAIGASRTNSANRRIAYERNQFERQEAATARNWSGVEAVRLRDFQRQQAQQQMDFQDRMSSTAVTRRMKDMQKAGINPILAGKYDASSPAGAMGTGAMPNTAKANSQGYTAINEIQPFLENLGTALSLRKLAAESEKAEHDAGISENVKKLGAPGAGVMEDAGSLYDTAKKALKDVNLRNDITNEAVKAGSATSKAIKNVTDNISTKLGKIAEPIRHEGKKWEAHKQQLKKKRKLGYVFGWDKEGKPIYQYERNKHKSIVRWRKP